MPAAGCYCFLVLIQEMSPMNLMAASNNAVFPTADERVAHERVAHGRVACSAQRPKESLGFVCIPPAV